MFYKAIINTETFEEIGAELIPGLKVASRGFNRAEIEEATAEDIAEALRSSGEWNLELCEALCDMADMSEEWCNTEDFESVVYSAAEKLGVEIYERRYRKKCL